MAVVLSSEDTRLYSSSALRRSQSQSKFMKTSRPAFRSSSSTSRLGDAFDDSFHQSSYQPVSASSSLDSSTPSSPRNAHPCHPSYSSTPATNASLDSHCEGSEGSDNDETVKSDDITIEEAYAGNQLFPRRPLDEIDSPASPDTLTGNSYAVTPSDTESEPSTEVSAIPARSPDALEHAEDDTAVIHQPTHHVDYLSHNWKEEDIWSSWRYIVSKRGEFTNGPRLENASWRTWVKAKYRLGTVSPETLNWLKDCDVTWLYGPLQTRTSSLFITTEDPKGCIMSRYSSYLRKKPILKKRSMSEVMLQRSISSSSLLKQATAVIQAQQTEVAGKPGMQRASSDYVTFPFSIRRLSRNNTSLLPSTDTSGVVSPSTDRKHIHFDEQVQQCIAVDVKGDDDDDEDEDATYGRCFYESDSDDGAIMMKKTKPKKKSLVLRRKVTKTVTSGESKTIAMLPSTKLKYREDTPEPHETALAHSSSLLGSPLLSPSSSQETLRPCVTSFKYFHDAECRDGLYTTKNATPVSSPVEPPSTWQPVSRSPSASSLTAEPEGMRRTASGMFMPYEEGEPQANDGIIGRVMDTINTARDIAHVIWNVGWRR